MEIGSPHWTISVANWLDVLKTDNRAIFTAAGHAQRAAAFINRPAAGGLRRLATDRGIRGSPYPSY